MHCPTCHRASGPQMGRAAVTVRDAMVAKMSSDHALCPECGIPTGKNLLENNGKCEGCRKADLTMARTIPMKLEACR